MNRNTKYGLILGLWMTIGWLGLGGLQGIWQYYIEGKADLIILYDYTDAFYLWFMLPIYFGIIITIIIKGKMWRKVHG